MALQNLERQRRQRKIRKKIRQSGRKYPRLSVFRSHRHLSIQLIDDTKGITIVSARDAELGDMKGSSRDELARALGKLIAERARSQRIQQVVFDRGPYAYHGIVKALAEGAREGGLTF